MLSLRSKAYLLRNLFLLRCNNLSTEPVALTQPQTAYGFHPNVTTIDAPYQSLFLTKTLLFNELAPSLSQESSELTNSLEQLIRDAIITTVGKDKRVLTRRYKEKPEKELNTSDYYLSLIMNLLRIALAPQGTAQPVLTYRPYVAFEWRALDTFSQELEWIRVRGRPFAWLLSSSKDRSPPLLVPDQEEVRELSLSPLPDLYPVSPLIGFPKLTEIRPTTTSTSSVVPEFRVPHTLVYLHNIELSHEQNFQCVVMQLFSLLANYATTYCGANRDTELAVPVSGQAILTTGDKFTYFYYQLNTLDTVQPSTGCKNMLFTSDGEIPLYKFDLLQDKIEEFNLECLRMFVQTLNNFTK